MEEKKEPEKKTKRHVRGIWAVTLILFLCVLLATAVWVYVIANNNKGVFSIINFGDKVEETKKNADEEKNKGLKQYINISALFSFWYPETWTLEEKNNAIYLSSDTNYPKSYLEGSMPEMKDTDIYIQIHFSNESLDISREAPAGKPKITNFTIGGISAKRVTYNNGENLSEIIQSLKSGDFNFLIITDTKIKNQDKVDAYNKMLDSFKFGNEVIEEAKDKK